MKILLKKNLTRIIVWSICIILIAISIGFSSFIDSFLIKALTNKHHLVSNNKLIVHFIDVGQADGIAINFPNGEIALIDSGSEDSSHEFIEYLKSKVFTDNKYVIDYLFFTHSDIDHTGGISSIVNNCKVKNIIRPREYASFEKLNGPFDKYVESVSFYNCMKEVYKEGANIIPATDEMHFNIGDVDIDIYYPEKEIMNSNNSSYLIKMSYKGKSILFTGDMDSYMEEQIVIENGDNLKADILKVAHHGSDSSSSEMFLKAIDCEYAVISVGKNNWGHPTDEVINRLYKNEIKEVLRTDLEGSIVFSFAEDIEHFIGKIYISRIEFSYIQLAWCLIFIIIVNQVYWWVCLIKSEGVLKIKKNKQNTKSNIQP